MGRGVSGFLDLVRLLAALAVFLSHVSWQDHSGGMFWQLNTIGREAVDVFFVLSGFVIGHVVSGRHSTARDYAVARLARIFSVALPALVLTYIVDEIGRAFRPELYHGFCCDQGGAPAWQMLRNLVFLGNVWSAEVTPGSNIPYWSLGFEAWYYLAFGLFVFLPARLRWLGAGAALLAAGPGIAVLFPLWLLGVACRTLEVPRRVGWALFVGGLVGVVLAAVCEHRLGQIYDPFAFSLARWGDYGQDYLVGGCFAISLIGLRATGEDVAGWFSGLRTVRWAAGATFALYLFHVPLIRMTVAVSPWPASSWAVRGMVLLGVPLLVLGLAELTERRKSLWRNGVSRVLGGA